MKGPLVRLADQWVSRRCRLSPSVQSARDAVSHLKPIAVITGGSRGIGAALALEIATRDSDVAIVARSADVLKATAERIKAVTGRDAVALQIDVTDPSAAASIERELTSRGYYLDVLVSGGKVIAGNFNKAA